MNHDAADFTYQDCLNNAGQKRPPDSEMKPPSIVWINGSEDADRNGLPDRYEQWWEEEAAYGGRHPQIRCGTSYAGGISLTTCGWFWV